MALQDQQPGCYQDGGSVKPGSHVRRWGMGNTSPALAAHPQLGGISFLHRFGSALNRHVHLHACATDGVLTSTADGPTCDAAPAFLPMHQRSRPAVVAGLVVVQQSHGGKP